MSQGAFTSRARAAAETISEERHRALIMAIRDVRGRMNERGILPSSMYVNAVFSAGTEELTAFASSLWDSLKRSHQACGASPTSDLTNVFDQLLSSERTKMESACNEATFAVRRQLGNPGMIWGTALADVHASLLRKYQFEIDIYVACLTHGGGSSLAERTKRNLLNRPLIAIALVVVAGVAGVATLTDSISKLAEFARRIFGGGHFP